MAASCIASSSLSTPLDREICAELTILEDEIYDAVLLDEFSLRGLVSRLASLNNRVASTQAISKGLLRRTTVSLIRTLSAKAQVIASNMLNIHRSAKDIGDRRASQLAEVFSRVSLSPACKETIPSSKSGRPSSLQPKGIRLARSHSSSSASSSSDTAVESEDNHTSSEVPEAMKWLSKHLHNPYPTTVEKARIARRSGTSQKSVGVWFANMRRRIGWSALLKKHFAGDRAAAVDCAHRIFSEGEGIGTIPAKVLGAFAEMKATLENIIERDVEASELAQTIESCDDSSPEKRPKSPRKQKPTEGTHKPHLSGSIPRKCQGTTEASVAKGPAKKRRCPSYESSSSVTACSDHESDRPAKCQRTKNVIEQYPISQNTSSDISALQSGSPPSVNEWLVSLSSVPDMSQDENMRPSSRKRRRSDDDADDDGSFIGHISKRARDGDTIEMPLSAPPPVPVNYDQFASTGMAFTKGVSFDFNFVGGGFELEPFDYNKYVESVPPLPSNLELESLLAGATAPSTEITPPTDLTLAPTNNVYDPLLSGLFDTSGVLDCDKAALSALVDTASNDSGEGSLQSSFDALLPTFDPVFDVPLGSFSDCISSGDYSGLFDEVIFPSSAQLFPTGIIDNNPLLI